MEPRNLGLVSLVAGSAGRLDAVAAVVLGRYQNPKYWLTSSEGDDAADRIIG
jgi:hypothetical protein|tara:strand:+ start:310 stop:465 length:156 start_codon:yes stop_codon:yes gene_type:complete